MPDYHITALEQPEMSIRKNTNPRPLELPPEMQNLLARNGMRGHIAGSSEGFVLLVQGHDSPLLSYPITEKQLQALTDWGTNYANRRCYNTFASIVAADFDLPRDFVHARNANGRVAMGLHGYRIGAGEYGRLGRPFPLRHPWGACFLGWTPRQQDGFHLRRIGGNLYYPGAPMVPNRPDGRMKPGELQSGGYGFYYKGHPTTTVAGQDVLEELETVITPLQPRPRPTEPAKPYHTLITSPVYFTNEKWQECLASHGILIDPERKTLTIQSASIPADLQYDLKEEELAVLKDDDSSDFSRLRDWVYSTEDGTLSDLKDKRALSLFHEIASDINTCKGAKCPYFSECFFYESRKKAKRARIIVTNHHLFILDGRSRLERNIDYDEDAVLPSFDYAVLDEAHHLEEESSRLLSSSYSYEALRKTIDNLLKKVTNDKNNKHYGQFNSRLSGTRADARAFRSWKQHRNHNHWKCC